MPLIRYTIIYICNVELTGEANNACRILVQGRVYSEDKSKHGRIILKLT
jgi:hypothetical protein